MLPRRVSRRQWQDWAVALWPPVLAVVLVFPLLTRSGHPLARDLVFVPRQPFTNATWGLGDVAPRAVPLDSVVALLTHVVDGGVLARVVLPLTLALWGWGVARLLKSSGRIAQLAGGGFAVWNAFVVERLALGQWALLLGCAALPWVVAAAMRYRREGRRRDLAAAVAWAALASLTPTGGVLALLGLLAACAPHLRRVSALLAPALMLQLPWVVAGITGPAGTVSDGAAVAAFAPDTESPYGPFVALLGLGGIWDSGSEPATRTTWMALVAAAVVLAALVVGLSLLRRAWGTEDTVRWAGLAGLLAILALAGATPWGAHVLVGAVDTVPGAGLLRDTQKFMAPAAVLAAAAFGACVGSACRAVASSDVRPLTALVLIVTPILLLPDATTKTWPTVAPVRFPDDLERVAQRLAGEEGVVVTLPWRAYRAFDWTRPGQTASDPATRMVDADVVTSDSLQVGTVTIAGESPLAADIGHALDVGTPAKTLPPLGVTWVVLYADDPQASQVDTTGLQLVIEGEYVDLYLVPGATTNTAGSGARTAAVWGSHLLALLVALAAGAVAVATRRLSGQDQDVEQSVM